MNRPHRPLLSRRRLLATAGVTLTLPLLPSLLWSRKAGAAECGNVQRFVAYMFPNGHHMPEHMPDGVGSGDAWSLPPMLEPMQELKSELTFVSGLENQERRKTFGDHAIGCGSMLTARMPTKNQQKTNMSVDQAIAEAIADCGTSIPSLQYGTHNVSGGDAFGTYYTRNISWRGQSITNEDGTKSFPYGDATPLGKEIDLEKAFDRLFEGSDPEASQAEAEMRRALRKSVLDGVAAQGASLRAKLNPADLHKVDELFTGIRELELQIAATNPGTACDVPDRPISAEAFEQRLDQWHSLMTLALQCDLSRVITFMLGDAQSDRNLSFIPDVRAIGGNADDHAVSHHSNQSALEAKFRAMVLWKQQQIAKFLTRLKSATDASGEPILNSMLVFISSELGDGNAHNHDNLPILLAGRLGGLVVPDRHVHFSGGRNFDVVKTYGDFFITLLDLYGVRVTEFGNDGKEPIQWQK
jgi:hypothetical protein